MAGEGNIPETISKVVIYGKDSEGNFVPILVDSEGKVITTTELPAE